MVQSGSFDQDQIAARLRGPSDDDVVIGCGDRERGAVTEARVKRSQECGCGNKDEKCVAIMRHYFLLQIEENICSAQSVIS